MPIKKYTPQTIEKKVQQAWEKDKVFEAKEDKNKPKFYALIEFPYPSGAGLHVGHVRPFTAMDVIARKKRMEGYNVLYPIGFDAFGLPTENFAIKTGKSPEVVTKENIANFTKQMKALGLSFDWSRQVDTTDPDYYKWTQWIFLQLFKKGLAYKKNQPINWCPKDKIGLANEEVVGGCCERCGTAVERRNKEQWMLAITKYADKLLEGLNEVDYIREAKQQQENWIGKSEGAEIEFKIKNNELKIKVFTTRPDTIFGVTYLVVAPEHPLINNEQLIISNPDEVQKYVENARKKSDLERTELQKEKTGVELKGIKVIHPLTQEEIPVYVADYVLGNYGTGGVMAVPAHDERDFEFAKKYNLPIKQVVAPHFYDDTNPPQKDKKNAKRIVVQGIVKHWSEDKVIQIQWKKFPWKTFVIGGAEEEENLEEAVKREIEEETGYADIKSITKIGAEMRSEWFAKHKDENRYALMHAFLIELGSGKKNELSDEEKEKHEVAWVDFKTIPTSFGPVGELNYIWKNLQHNSELYEGEGMLINSGKFSELKTDEAKEKIIAWLEKNKVGKKETQYKLRDWVFSRQRYWGEPIPLVYCENCKEKNIKNKEQCSEGELLNPGWIPLPESALPLTLPKVEKYEPTDTGESPLSKIEEWVNTICPKCGGPARRETDTMPNWAGSSWYFLRYTDPHNDKEFASKENLNYWMPVDWYNGGMEHTVLHLLYSRFWNQFLFDIGALPTREPYKKRTSHGMILAKGGEKMSKSKGNVVNPDEMIEKFGADALRTYIMFMGPFDQAVEWDTNGVIGVRRFLERVWNLQEKIGEKPQDKKITTLLHQTIKKVTEDIEAMRFNTAVASLMELTNECNKLTHLYICHYETIIKLLFPFAPHICEEIYNMYFGKNSFSYEPWPTYDPKLTKNDETELVIQINGKVRDSIIVPAEISEEEAKEKALSSEKVKKWLDGKEPKKIIYVKGKLISIVI